MTIAIVGIGLGKREQLLLIAADGKREGAQGRTFYFADDRRNEGEFWLTRESGGFSIGPVYGPNHMRNPGIFTPTRRGYEAARAARFEHGEKPEA